MQALPHPLADWERLQKVESSGSGAAVFQTSDCCAVSPACTHRIEIGIGMDSQDWDWDALTGLGLGLGCTHKIGIGMDSQDKDLDALTGLGLGCTHGIVYTSLLRTIIAHLTSAEIIIGNRNKQQ